MAETKIDRSRNMAPLDVDGVKTTKIGTAAFAIALILCLVFNQKLAEHGTSWWIWTCVAGIVLGLLTVIYTSRRAKVYAAARESGELHEETPTVGDNK